MWRATTASSVSGTGRRSCARSGTRRSRRTVSSSARLRPGTPLGSAGQICLPVLLLQVYFLVRKRILWHSFSKIGKVVLNCFPRAQGSCHSCLATVLGCVWCRYCSPYNVHCVHYCIIICVAVTAAIVEKSALRGKTLRW